MVVLVTGTMGGGKTYFCVEKAFHAWQRGSMVHDNFTWADAAQKYVKLHTKLPRDPAKWATRNEEGHLVSDVIVRGSEQCPNLVLIDEAYLYLGIHDRIAHAERNRFLLEFCAMSRQLGLEIYFISQSAENIDVGVRKIAAYHIHCVNNKKIPGIGAFASRILGQFVRITKSPQKNLELSRESANLNKEIAALYNTHGQGDQIQAATHVGQGVVKVKTSGRLKFFLALVVIAPIVGWWIMSDRAEKVLQPEKLERSAAVLGDVPATVSGAEPVKSERSIVAWATDPEFSLVLEDGTELSMTRGDFPLVSARRSEGGYTVRTHDGKETFYPFKR